MRYQKIFVALKYVRRSIPTIYRQSYVVGDKWKRHSCRRSRAREAGIIFFDITVIARTAGDKSLPIVGDQQLSGKDCALDARRGVRRHSGWQERKNIGGNNVELFAALSIDDPEIVAANEPGTAGANSSQDLSRSTSAKALIGSTPTVRGCHDDRARTKGGAAVGRRTYVEQEYFAPSPCAAVRVKNSIRGSRSTSPDPISQCGDCLWPRRTAGGGQIQSVPRSSAPFNKIKHSGACHDPMPQPRGQRSGVCKNASQSGFGCATISPRPSLPATSQYRHW
jgi:hypothetical protein